jgi:hypothetical protein
MLLIWSWSATAIDVFVGTLGPDLFPFSVGSHSLTSALRIVGFIAALELGLAIVVALVCWLVLELAGILVKDRKPSTAEGAINDTSTCANRYSFRDEFDLPAKTRL